jgi:serine/threonine protein kinase
LDYDLAKFWAAQILGALSHLRENNIVHRDLKPANIVLNEHH